MRSLSYSREQVLADLASGELKPFQIADKHNITVGNVYAIKAQAVKAGAFPAKARRGSGRKFEDHTVFTAALRERIKDLRDQDFTSSEIAVILSDSIPDPFEEAREKVIRVKSRSGGEWSRRRYIPPIFKSSPEEQIGLRLIRAGCNFSEFCLGLQSFNKTQKELEILFSYAQRWGKVRG